MSALLRTVLDTQSSEMFPVTPKGKEPFVAFTQHGLYLEMTENLKCLYSSLFLGLESLEML